jgi:hypothetical protein
MGCPGMAAGSDGIHAAKRARASPNQHSSLRYCAPLCCWIHYHFSTNHTSYTPELFLLSLIVAVLLLSILQGSSRLFTHCLVRGASFTEAHVIWIRLGRPFLPLSASSGQKSQLHSATHNHSLGALRHVSLSSSSRIARSVLTDRVGLCPSTRCYIVSAPACQTPHGMRDNAALSHCASLT